MARQSLSPMKDLDYIEPQMSAAVSSGSVGRKRKGTPITHLKYLRRKCGYTLESLADVTSISVSYLSRLESGSRRLNTDLIRRLSHAFNCTAAELLQETMHESGSETSSEFPGKAQRERHKVTSRESYMPFYQLKQNENDPTALTLSILSNSEWKQRPQELASRPDAFALKAGTHFLPHFSATSTLFMEPANNLAPESTVVILNQGQVMIKKIWSVTPTSLQLCDIADMDLLKNGADAAGKLLEINRASLDAAYKVVGYSDFGLA